MMQSFPSSLRSHVIVATMMMMMMTLCVVFPQYASAAEAEQPQRKLPLVGSYSPMPVTDPMATEAADYALTTLWTEPASNTNTNYSFLSSSTKTSTPSPQVIEAAKQVVAGLNIQLTIMVKDGNDDSCLGAFGVVVYNQFGDLSVTRWGDEVTCQAAYEKLSKDGEDAARK
mmetsp:Transcript_86036/g.128911  ORF Transcript_86036/g.128911 Transcript_86036/m.128911 type:complete len:171 (+) Transcript_86036:96-608(+)|eukprot:CAMPEP_0117026112 /NCGR_PEP_ID=MMETSP0472-20121206/19218_1 /TAXON_ID=693140 ORGANISM="Tiarina fusus, Strain LIS" /NCGR_SAMPLE_ID=MMETSP0472 /ASSEMBLY_ACC=CAM_ASM_000603 /LENGTH=170 /DNA_ID=CAMNT_0004733007 /DNA_START=104 /DNA_END=616 /DNA_ORIENTATION=-